MEIGDSLHSLKLLEKTVKVGEVDVEGSIPVIRSTVMCQDIVPVFWHILFCFCVGMCQDIVPFLSVMVVAGRSF